MPVNERNKWNKIYADGDSHKEISPSLVLEEYSHLLPLSGSALDIACGRGGNAILLAQQGLETHAWDISEIVLQDLITLSTRSGLDIHTQGRDISLNPPDPDSFDVITVSRFLDRGLIPHLINALKTEGLIFYQTFTIIKRDDTGPSNSAYRLESNELLKLFGSMKIILYREEGKIGDLDKGFRNEAMLIAQKI